MERRIVVVPADPIKTYEDKGNLNYFSSICNPDSLFDKVFVTSPAEIVYRDLGWARVVPSSYHTMRRTIQGLMPHVIRAFGGHLPSDCTIYNRVAGIPIIVSIHDSNPQLCHPSIRYADLVICTSKITARLAHQVAPSVPIEIIPNGIDLDLFLRGGDDLRIRKIAHEFNEQKIILFVGRKTEQKNLDTVLRSLALLDQSYVLIAIGHGDKSYYEGIAKQAGVAGRVTMIDSVSREDLVNYYRAAHCLCNPSRWEGFGNVFVEAAAAGCPVVTSAISPMDEIFSHRLSAILIDHYEDPCMVAAAINSVCSDEALANRLRAAARTLVGQFDEVRIRKIEADLYRKVIDHWKIRRWHSLAKSRLSWNGGKRSLETPVGVAKKSILLHRIRIGDNHLSLEIELLNRVERNYYFRIELLRRDGSTEERVIRPWLALSEVEPRRSFEVGIFVDPDTLVNVKPLRVILFDAWEAGSDTLLFGQFATG